MNFDHNFSMAHHVVHSLHLPKSPRIELLQSVQKEKFRGR